MNNNVDMVIILLYVPAKTFIVDPSSTSRLFIRTDKTKLVDIHLDLKTFVEKKSKIDFSKYVVNKVKY